MCSAWDDGWLGRRGCRFDRLQLHGRIDLYTYKLILKAALGAADKVPIFLGMGIPCLLGQVVFPTQENEKRGLNSKENQNENILGRKMRH